MKTRLRFLTLSLILVFGSSAFGQTEARLFTEFGPAANCEAMQAQLDAWTIEIRSNPSAVGKIVTYGDRTKPLDAFFREAMIKRYVTIRIPDPERVKSVRGEFRSEIRTELWVMPAGAGDPKISRADWSYELPGLTEPLKFGSTGETGLVECENYDFGLLVKFLEANPTMTVKAVFKETSTAKYGAAVKEFGDALAEKGIARERLTASYVRVSAGKYLESTEIWLVPGMMVTADGPRPKVINAGVVNGKATVLPTPEYPAAARAVKATGAVNVQVDVDEKGNVVSAMAVSGHPLLRASAVNAAKGAKFRPTFLFGEPVRFTGILVFNFVP